MPPYCCGLSMFWSGNCPFRQSSEGRALLFRHQALSNSMVISTGNCTVPKSVDKKEAFCQRSRQKHCLDRPAHQSWVPALCMHGHLLAPQWGDR